MSYWDLIDSQDTITRTFQPAVQPQLSRKVLVNTTADPDQPLMRSNVFTLLAPENYTQPTCINQTVMQVVANINCANLSVHSDQTVLPVPTTKCSKLPDCTTVGRFLVYHNGYNYDPCTHIVFLKILEVILNCTFL